MILSSVPLLDKAGNIAASVVAPNDITECKRTKEALRKIEQQVTHKLENFHCHERELEHLDLADIIDVTALQTLMDNFYKLAHIPMSITDLKGRVHVGVGWQDICTEFHRAHTDTCRHCIESDTQLSRGISPGEFRLYKCKNKMWDIATPIMVGDQHVGNVFLGQFFFDDELLDYDFFRSQARQYGFNEEEYISALEAAPCLSREVINTGITFLMQLADMISKLSYSNIKLVRSLVERDALMESLRKSEERLNSASLAAGIGVWSWTPGTSNLIVSANWRSLFGISEEHEVTFETWRDALHPDDREYAVNELNAASEQHREFDVEYRIVSPDGTVRWIVDRGRALYDEKGCPVSMAGVDVDITEQKRNEKSTWLSRLYSVLSKINQAIVRIRDPQKLFEEVCRVAVEDGQFRMAWIGLVDSDTKLIKVVTKHGHDESYLENVRISVDKDTPEGRGPTGIALREGRAFVNNDTENNPVMKPWRDEQLKRGYRASASFPFMIENQTIGVITLYANKTNYFDEEEIQLLQSLADDVSFAIESANTERQRSQAIEELRRARDELEVRVRERTANLETMHEITTIAASSLDIVKVSERVLKSLAERFGLSYATTFMINEELHELEPIALYGYPNDSFKNAPPFKLDSEYESVRVFRSGVPIVVEDVDNFSIVESSKEIGKTIEALTGIPFKSYMFLPLVAYKKIIGTMSLTWPTVRTFSQDDIDFYSSIANEITVGLENARLHTQTEEELTRTQLLQDITVAAASGPDLHAVSNGILQALNKHMHLKTGIIYQINERKQVFHALSQLNFNKDAIAEFKEFLLTSEEFHGPKVARADRIFTHKEDKPSPERVALLKQVGVWDTRYVVIPIKYKGKVTGSISLTFDGRRDFTQAELALFDSIAHIACQAIENARLYEAEKKRAEELAEHRKNLEKTIRNRTKEISDINARLRQSEAQHRQIIGASPDAYFVFAQNKILYANPAALQLFGHKLTREIDITTLKNLIMPEKYKDLEHFEGSQKLVHLGEITIAKEAGLPITVEGLVVPIVFEGETAYQYIIRDITQRKEIEKDIARLDRLNLVGQMAAGIAHEIRNPMTTVRGFLQLLGGKEEFAKHNGYFELMIEELDRANSIISEYLSVAKNKTSDMKLQSLNSIIENLFPLIQADAILSDKYINLELEDIPKLQLDEKEIRQLILNLVRNGLQAMSCGGEMNIRTYEADEVVALVVVDDGGGIEPDVLEKMGTPFFSTKDNGTGLGLAVCYSIAARHNANIKIETGANGTAFLIRFKQLE